MTVAYLVNQYPQSSQSFIRREIAALEKLGVNVARFTVRRWPGQLVDEADRREAERTRAVLDGGAAGLAIALLRTAIASPVAFFKAWRAATRIGRRSGRGVIVHWAYLAEACVLRRWFRKAGVRHVHAHFGTNSTTVAMLCRILGGPPYSFTAHGPEEFDKPEPLALGEKTHRAAFVAAISEFGRSQVLRWCGHDQWDKVHVVRCGLDEMFLHAPPAPPPPSSQLVCVGRLSAQKGQLLLLAACARLAAEGVDVRVKMVGDGELRSVIENRIKELKLENRVQVLGWQSNVEVRRHLLESRALVLPSLAEGLPVVIMEALALRRPVISTSIAGIPELVENGVCGWVVTPGSVDALTRAMREALAAPVERLRDMGEAGARRVAERHDASTEAAKLAPLFTKAGGS
ncbi:MAG TPA: glycosyltransferase family 4 protein [Planctomycetota bacterium]|nr:glycosyltransferase family 4 protein [Planctomycetota bacterium]